MFGSNIWFGFHCFYSKVVEPISQNDNSTTKVHTRKIFSLSIPHSFFSLQVSSCSLISLSSSHHIWKSNLKQIKIVLNIQTWTQTHRGRDKNNHHISDPNPSQPHNKSKPHTDTHNHILDSNHHNHTTKSEPHTHTHNHISKIQTLQPHLKPELHTHKSDQKLEITIKIP